MCVCVCVCVCECECVCICPYTNIYIYIYIYIYWDVIVSGKKLSKKKNRWKDDEEFISEKQERKMSDLWWQKKSHSLYYQCSNFFLNQSQKLGDGKCYWRVDEGCINFGQIVAYLKFGNSFASREILVITYHSVGNQETDWLFSKILNSCLCPFRTSTQREREREREKRERERERERERVLVIVFSS